MRGVVAVLDPHPPEPGGALEVEVDHFDREGDRFTINEFDIAAKIKPNTKLIVISDLHNPSGMLVEPDVVSSIMAFFFVFLCSDKATYSVGSTYYVDGGMLRPL